MKSKYAPLVRLKKENLEEARRALLQSNLKIQKLQEQISTIKSDLNGYEKPSHGSVLAYSQYALMINAYRQELDKTKDKLAVAFHHHNFAQDRLNKAMVEFEKFQYLQAQEEKDHLKKLKKLEAQHLDEVAVIGYNLQQVNK